LDANLFISAGFICAKYICNDLSGALVNRAPRSTRAILLDAELHQSAVIDTLVLNGDDDLAIQLTRCQYERQNRRPGWPWQCRLSGCWACRRATTRRWWRGFRLWLDDVTTSLAIILLNGDPIIAIRKLRRALRDVRDRAARRDLRWRGVALAGVLSNDHLLLLVQHAGIIRAATWSMLEPRWPDVVLGDVNDTEPSTWLTVKDAAALARRRRGIEPIRVVVAAQGTVTPLKCRWDDQAMPMLF